MSTTVSLGQIVKFFNVITPQDVPGATTINTRTNGYVDMSDFESGSMIVSAELTNLKTAVIVLTQASDAAGTSVGDVSGKTLTLTGATGATSVVGTIDFTTAELESSVEGEYFVGVKITTNQAGDDIQATLAAAGGTYQHKALNTNYDI